MEKPSYRYRELICYLLKPIIRSRIFQGPKVYPRLNLYLGNLYYSLRERNRETNLRQAIDCYNQALSFLTPEFTPYRYAMIHYNLGLAYSELLTDNLGAYQQLAIKYYEKALTLFTPDITPHEYAMVQTNLGSAYFDLPLGNREENLRMAIKCYENALIIYDPDTEPLEYAKTQNNLGNAYSDLPVDEQGTNLNHAICCYQEALRFFSPAITPTEYAMAQNNLGIAYNSLPIGNRSENLELAIRCYQEALTIYTVETAPLDFAMTNNNLGNAYTDLPHGDLGKNLTQAIQCYEAAFTVYNIHDAPFDYAMVLSNLGEAYRNLPAGDLGVNLSRAIKYFEEALKIYNPETAPLNFAMVQNNLGNAYRNLPTGGRDTNFRKAVRCFQKALTVYTSDTFPREYAITQNNLGNVYQDLPTGARKKNYLKAIECYEEALKFRDPKTTPYDYASTQNNLGNVYYDLSADDRGQNLEQAIRHFKNALAVYTPEITPREYARLQNNLGNAYRNSSDGDRGENSGLAIKCYEEALRFRIPSVAPRENRRTNRNLANLYFDRRNWAAALQTYRTAMDIGEYLYQTGLSAENKAVEVVENAICYHHAAFASVCLGDISGALIIMEQGKTRLLTEILRLRIPHPAGVPDDVWFEYERASATARATQAGLPARLVEINSAKFYEAQEQSINQANNRLDRVLEQIRHYAPEFLKPLDLAMSLDLVPNEQTVLVSFCITEKGSIGWIVTRNDDEPIKIVEIPSFTVQSLRAWIHGSDEIPSHDSWLGAYGSQINGHFQAVMDRVLLDAGAQLIAPILDVIPSGIEQIIFCPSGEMFLLPLHAAHLPGKTTRLGDVYRISYGPSMEVLAALRSKTLGDNKGSFYAIINPEEDPKLAFALTEGRAIANLFKESCIHTGRGATKEIVVAGMPGRTYLHFSCHGFYNWNDPPASGLSLADDPLTLTELQSGIVDLSEARLVTLSACETGIVDVLKGNPDEFVGLPAAFMMAGVPCVVSSLWKVPDLSTALLMERFYRNHLERGQEFSAALQEAQLWVRDLPVSQVIEYTEKCLCQAEEKNQRELIKYQNYYKDLSREDPTHRLFAHPYYWAAFTVYGS
ncbi:MAG TPA: CHAT domain-containing protein [Bacillota bacterium]|nr:CHAT domain-containing protein [Bacillota bacterium]